MKECSSGSSFRPGIAPKEMEPARLAAARPGMCGRSGSGVLNGSRRIPNVPCKMRDSSKVSLRLLVAS
jgi:hypothetical protein